MRSQARSRPTRRVKPGNPNRDRDKRQESLDSSHLNYHVDRGVGVAGIRRKKERKKEASMVGWLHHHPTTRPPGKAIRLSWSTEKLRYSFFHLSQARYGGFFFLKKKSKMQKHLMHAVVSVVVVVVV